MRIGSFESLVGDDIGFVGHTSSITVGKAESSWALCHSHVVEIGLICKKNRSHRCGFIKLLVSIQQATLGLFLL